MSSSPAVVPKPKKSVALSGVPAGNTALCMSEPVPAITRQVKVLALNSCSAYRMSEVCMARTASSLGFLP